MCSLEPGTQIALSTNPSFCTSYVASRWGIGVRGNCIIMMLWPGIYNPIFRISVVFFVTNLKLFSLSNLFFEETFNISSRWARLLLLHITHLASNTGINTCFSAFEGRFNSFINSTIEFFERGQMFLLRSLEKSSQVLLHYFCNLWQEKISTKEQISCWLAASPTFIMVS